MMMSNKGNGDSLAFFSATSRLVMEAYVSHESAQALQSAQKIPKTGGAMMKNVI